MRRRIVSLGLLSVFSAFVSAPIHLHGQQPEPQPQAQHQHDTGQPATASPTPAQDDTMAMMMRMKAAGAKLDALVKKMNETKGSAKTDAMAELLTAMVEEQKACEPMMQHMMGMMGMVNMSNGNGRGSPMMPNK